MLRKLITGERWKGAVFLNSIHGGFSWSSVIANTTPNILEETLFFIEKAILITPKINIDNSKLRESLIAHSFKSSPASCN